MLLQTCSWREIYRNLQLCNKTQDLASVRKLYSCIIKGGFDAFSFFGDHLIRLFASCHVLEEAYCVFFALARRTVYTWHAIISAHTKVGDGHSALKLYHGMLLDGIQPDRHVLTCCLKACCLVDDIDMGMTMHTLVTTLGLDHSEAIGSALIDMYASCRFLEEACDVFESSASQDIVIWDTLMSGCVRQGLGIHTLSLFERMLKEGVEPSKLTFVFVFKACSDIADLSYGLRLHTLATENGVKLDLKVGNTLVDLYVKCGSLMDAYDVFCALPSRGVVAWCCLISGYAEHGHNQLAVSLFECMHAEGLIPDKITYLSVLKACGNEEFIHVGRLVHNYILQTVIHLDTVIVNTLINMYAKCGSILEARALYELWPDLTIVSCAAMISGYAQHGYGLQALELYEALQIKGMKPTVSVYASILNACESIDAIDFGREVHNEIMERMFEWNIQIGNTLIDFYSKCHFLPEAFSVFHRMPNRDIVSWDALLTGCIGGCIGNGNSSAALELYEEMTQEGIFPDKVSFLACLRACTWTDKIMNGREIHRRIVFIGLESDIAISTSLVEMYSRCGCIPEARNVFEECPHRDSTMWGTLIAGYAYDGSENNVKECLRHMQREGLELNDVLLTSILSARSIQNAMDICHAFSEYMSCSGNSQVSIEHFSSIVDLLGRVGYLDEAEGLVHTMPISPNIISWSSLLMSSINFGAHKLGYRCFDGTK
ncbi:hypothetical protein KP509_19G048200 [Ceratopteris richardii]|uniref:Pentatricopeptide repeat-containing protein n=1 Tax=Ceratopteris richardii TaxID=49495 RepID=A0A8T2SM41_CERRI|nr:hypothetical protein KP509_19G048200 [Ceratopteris richardii]